MISFDPPTGTDDHDSNDNNQSGAGDDAYVVDTDDSSVDIAHS
jgi:hypothetical protein